MDRNKGSRKKLSKRQILLIAAAALAAVLLLTGRLTPAGLINSLLGTDIPEAQQTYESVQPAETAEDLPPAEKNEPPEETAELEQTAIDEDGQIMALRHRQYDIPGIQFHPESVLTPDGHTIIRNFLTD